MKVVDDIELKDIQNNDSAVDESVVGVDASHIRRDATWPRYWTSSVCIMRFTICVQLSCKFPTSCAQSTKPPCTSLLQSFII